MYQDRKEPEKDLVRDIIRQLNAFDVMLTWAGSAVPRKNKGDEDDPDHVNGIYGDFYILHQRCEFHNIDSPFKFEYENARPDLKDPNKHHIDLHFLFDQTYIKSGLFGARYRSTSLEDVSSSLLGTSKYSYTNSSGNLIQVSGNCVDSQPLKHQVLYVARDAELTMMLAINQDCLLLRGLAHVAKYSHMDFYDCCKSYMSWIYRGIYDRMVEIGECKINPVLNKYKQRSFEGVAHKIWIKPEKHPIVGGLALEPARAFISEPVDILDVKSLYPSLAITYNISFETINCNCCQFDPNALVPPDVIAEINDGLTKKHGEALSEKLWICKRNVGAYPATVRTLLLERKKIQTV